MFWLANNKLLYFLKLMQPEKTMDIFAMSSSLSSETARIATHSLRQLFGLQCLSSIVTRHCLLACGN